jgi:hypothetical protein
MGLCYEPSYAGSGTFNRLEMVLSQLTMIIDDSERPGLRGIPDPETVLRVRRLSAAQLLWLNSDDV